MRLAGVFLADGVVLELALLVRHAGFDELADSLDASVEVGTEVLALTIADRAMILRALEDSPESLAELRGVLLREHEWRVREGLV